MVGLSGIFAGKICEDFFSTRAATFLKNRLVFMAFCKWNWLPSPGGSRKSPWIKCFGSESLLIVPSLGVIDSPSLLISYLGHFNLSGECSRAPFHRASNQNFKVDTGRNLIKKTLTSLLTPIFRRKVYPGTRRNCVKFRDYLLRFHHVYWPCN